MQVNARLSNPSGMTLVIMLSRTSLGIRVRAILVFAKWRDADEHIERKEDRQKQASRLR